MSSKEAILKISKKLKENKYISTKYIQKFQGTHTASAHITTDKNDNQNTAFHNGALNKADKLNTKNIKKNMKIGIFSPNKPKAMYQYIKECRNKDLISVFDPGQQTTSFNKQQIKEIINYTDVLIGNDYEINLIQQILDKNKKWIADKLKFLIITLDPKGSKIIKKNKEINIAACKPKKIKDPTGAGDAYRAGFFASYLSEKSLKKCGRNASVVASFAIEEYGTQNHEFTLKSVENRYSNTYNKRPPRA